MKMAVLVVLAPAIAAAQAADPATLRAQGEELARGGRFSEAIDKFKAADHVTPSAANACLIALAYTRRELWPQAEIWLETCRGRATAADPLPDWTTAATNQIRDRLVVANVAPVEIVVEPATARAEITVSSFALDEQFAPRTIHLPFGRHTFVATARGFEEARAEVVVDDRTPKRIVIELQRPRRPVRGPAALRVSGLAIGGAGVIALGAGVAFGLAARGDANQVSQRTTGQWTPEDKATYEAGQRANRRMEYSYIVGAALVATGGALYYFGARTHLEPIVTEREAGVAIAGRF